MSALEMFTAKPATSKTEKKDNKKPEDAQQDKDDEVIVSKVAQLLLMCTEFHTSPMEDFLFCTPPLPSPPGNSGLFPYIASKYLTFRPPPPPWEFPMTFLWVGMDFFWNYTIPSSLHCPCLPLHSFWNKTYYRFFQLWLLTLDFLQLILYFLLIFLYL